jgi:hypothetical protein
VSNIIPAKLIMRIETIITYQRMGERQDAEDAEKTLRALREMVTVHGRSVLVCGGLAGLR